MTIAKLERAAAVSSRPAKQHAVAGTTLHDNWAAQARATGFSADDLTAAAIDLRPAGSDISDSALIAEALRLVAEESSTWLRADVARHLVVLLPAGAGMSAAEVVAHIDRLAAQAVDGCVGLAPDRRSAVLRRSDGRPVAEHVTDRRLTTRTILDQEIRLQRWAETSADPVAPSILDPQAAAAEAMAGSASLVVVVGPAGTGKTTTTARAVRALRAQDRPVIGLAPSGKAADVLAAEAGCRTSTLAGFLTHHRSGRPTPWPRGTTVVLDEASMANTDDLAGLAARVQRNGWRLIAVGDPAQLPAVGRGGVFAHWCATLPHHKLVTPRRFDHPWEAAASLALRAGDAAVAETYATHRRLHAIHPALVAGEVAIAHQNLTRAGRTVAITANTAETARTINIEIQRRLDPAGRRPGVRLADGTCAHLGDQIATRRNDPNLRTETGQVVRNRHTWTMTGLAANGEIVAAHPERGPVTLPPSYVSEHVELGWAVTGYGNQGDTVDIGLAVLEPGTTRNHAYVALTRGRASNRAWIPDASGTDDPAERLAAMIAHTTDHYSALATHAKLHRDAGLPVPRLAPAVDISETEPATTALSPRSAPAKPSTDERVRAIQERLDRLERQSRSRSLGR